MLEARFKYQLLERKEIDADQAFSLSLQHVLDCSYYNQGCDGGYSYLVSKFYNEFDLRSEESYRNNQQCYPSDSINDKNFKRFSVSDYYYVGGAYGRTNEQNMIEELYRRGPFVVSLEPGTIFASVCSGEIYDGPNKVIRIENWERVDHSVLLVGYGVDEKSGKKYWEILNSWGESWCDGGFTRVLRGKNMMSIESIGEAAIPEIN